MKQKHENYTEKTASIQETKTTPDAVLGNREYKDTVFRMLFSEKSELLSLYNAVNGTQYDDPEELQITTLKNAVYMTVKNDLSCLIDTRLNLYEHQSTVNPNIPLRDLDYVSRTYSLFYRNKDIYSPRIIRLPNPKFIVFYNGVDEQPARREMRLSDAYVNAEEHPSLELVVVQININPGYNDELLGNCPTLWGYMQFVEKIRNYQESLGLTDAVTRAVNDCIKENILADFLSKHKAEVIAMSIYEYDEKLHEKTMMEIGREEGFSEGHASGLAEGHASGLAEGDTRRLLLQIIKKIKKSKSAAQIADELEEDITAIQPLYDIALQFAPEYNIDVILTALTTGNKL